MDNKREWTPCLKVKGVILPTGYYFGASAMTGGVSDNHDILSMKMFELAKGTRVMNKELRDTKQERGDTDEERRNAVPSAPFFEPPRDHVEDPKKSFMSGIKRFFLLLLGALGCVACVVIGYVIYQNPEYFSTNRVY